MASRWIIGLSSGTSLDGVDAALVEIEGVGLDMRLRPMHFLHQDYPQNLREMIRRVAQSSTFETRQATLVHRLLGEVFATCAKQLTDVASLSMQKVQCIGCSNHTIGHDTETQYPSTLPLGMAPVIAERTGITTISDFRSRDLVAGGHGYPLTAIIDYLLFHELGEQRVLLHLGGMATLESLPRGPELRQLSGFQAAPCNILLDSLIRLMTSGRESYDQGGKHAVQGCCNEPLLARWLAHPALQKRPPKSMAGHTFGEPFAAQAVQAARENKWSLHDLLCTATHFVADAVAHAIHTYLPVKPDRVLLAGGGVRNGFLWRLLEERLKPMPMETTDRYGIPTQARKAIAYAGLAALTLDGVPASVPSVTGASGARLLGSITPGASQNWAHCLTWMAAQAAPFKRLSVA